MRVAITGGAGFIGSNLAELLVKNGFSVSVFDNFETGTAENLEGIEVSCTLGDLRDRVAITSFLESGKFDYCFHLAAMGSVPRSIIDTRSSFEANVLGTFNLMEIAKKMKLPVIYSSSSSVYGANKKLPKTENDLMSPISPYGSFKCANEALIQGFSQSFNLMTQTFRLFNVYGPRQNPIGDYSAVIPRWMMAAFNRNPIKIYGSGDQKRDFTYVHDVSHVMLQTLKENYFAGDVINLAFGQPITLNQLSLIFKNYFPKLEIIYAPNRAGDIKDSESDPTKLHKSFGNVPHTPFLEGFNQTFEWYKKKYGF